VPHRPYHHIMPLLYIYTVYSIPYNLFKITYSMTVYCIILFFCHIGAYFARGLPFIDKRRLSVDRPPTPPLPLMLRLCPI
jgi:hypothetical protein